MADHLTLERFSVGTAQDWTKWLDDYCVYGELKKWNAEKLITNLRFFVSGEVKDCVRHACAEFSTVTLETVSTEVVKLLGGTPDPLIAIRQLDSVCYNGNVGKTLLAIGELIPLAYPTITDKVHKDQMTWIHLQRLLPAEYQRDLIKAGIDQLDAAVERIRAFERADASVRPQPAGLYRTQSSTAANNPAPQELMKSHVACFACGLSDHVRNVCPFRHDICGQCERRGHLSTVCRGRPQQPRGGGRSRGRSWGNGRQSVPRSLGQTVNSTSIVAPLTWPDEDQTPAQLLHPQQQQQQPWMPLPPHPEPHQRPEQQPTWQQHQQQQQQQQRQQQ